MDLRQFFNDFFKIHEEIESFFDGPSTFRKNEMQHKKPRDIMLKSRSELENLDNRYSGLTEKNPFQGIFNQQDDSFFSKSVYHYSTDSNVRRYCNSIQADLV